MMGSQCDNCRKFAVAPSPDWWVLGQIPAGPSSLLSSVLGDRGAEPRTFCSALCVAEWAYAQAVITGPAAGIEPRLELPPGFLFSLRHPPDPVPGGEKEEP